MYHLIWFYILSVNIFAYIDGSADNGTKFKNMYVIKAITYQVGILTNETRTDDNATGDQVAITFFTKNGTDIDLNKIPPPLLTNVTGESMVAVAPLIEFNKSSAEPFMYWDDIIYGNKNTSEESSNSEDKSSIETRNTRNIEIKSNKPNSEFDDCSDYNDCRYEETEHIYKRDVVNESKPILKFVEGSAIIPQNVSINALYLPLLLNLQSNLSMLPVPIPNTSVVHYSKINALVKSTQTY